MPGVTSKAATDSGEEESGAQRELLEKRLREAEEAAKEAAREMEGVVAGLREEQV